LKTKVHKSKVDFGFLLFFFIIFLSTIGLMRYGENLITDILILSGILLFLSVCVLYIFYNISYVIKNDVLKIRCGFIYNKHLSIEKIKSISSTKTLISSPAASLDRIELHYGEYSSVVISPKNKRKFIEDLLEINPLIINKVF